MGRGVGGKPVEEEATEVAEGEEKAAAAAVPGPVLGLRDPFFSFSSRSFFRSNHCSYSLCIQAFFARSSGVSSPTVNDKMPCELCKPAMSLPWCFSGFLRGAEEKIGSVLRGELWRDEEEEEGEGWAGSAAFEEVEAGAIKCVLAPARKEESFGFFVKGSREVVEEGEARGEEEGGEEWMVGFRGIMATPL